MIPPSSRINRLPRFPFSRSFGAFARFLFHANGSFLVFSVRKTKEPGSEMIPSPSTAGAPSARVTLAVTVSCFRVVRVPFRETILRTEVAAFNDFRR